MEEDGNKVTYEMLITRSWIFTSGFYATNGNNDSQGPLLHRWEFSGKEVKYVSVIEAIVLNIYEEFHNITFGGKLINDSRVAWLVERENLIERFGIGTGEEVFQVLEWHLLSKERGSII